jgi:NDP-sugar pyrophosphorylase family protein
MNRSDDRNTEFSTLKAMIFAAGLGTRFKPWTEHHPKALALVNGKSLLQRNIEYLQRYGIRDVVLNVHHFAGQVLQELEKNRGWGSNIAISDESDYVLETGGGLLKAAAFFDKGPFLAINVDILTDLDLGLLIQHHFRNRPLVTLAVTERKSSRFFLFDRQSRLCGWRNTGTGAERITRMVDHLQPRAFSGVQVLDPLIFSLIRRAGRFSLVDLYLDLAADHSIIGFDHSGSKFVDVGKPESVAIAEGQFA